jgi:hypothetical protein
MLRHGHVVDGKILQSCEREKLKEFYEDWKKLCEERGYKPWNVVNVDEIGLVVDSSFYGKVVTAKLAALKEAEQEKEAAERETMIKAAEEERMLAAYREMQGRLKELDLEDARTQAEAEEADRCHPESDAAREEEEVEDEETEEEDDDHDPAPVHDEAVHAPKPASGVASPTGAPKTADQAWLRSVVLAPQRRTVVTLTLAANAEGWVLPACLIHHGKTIPPEYTRINDSVCKVVVNPETAWQTKATFAQYISEVIIPRMVEIRESREEKGTKKGKPHRSERSVLVLDGHGSRINCDLWETCRQNRIDVVQSGPVNPEPASPELSPRTIRSPN